MADHRSGQLPGEIPEDRPFAHVADAELGPRLVAAFAVDPTVVRTTVGDGHLALADRARGHLEAARATGSVYGLTTGVGALRHVAVDPDDTPTGHARRLLRSHAAGFGPQLDDGIARATMVIRLHQLLRGGAGVHPDLIRALAAALDRGAIPGLHAYGGIGTADLTVLAQLALTLAGELPWRSGGVAPVAIGAGDALPFISSNALTAAVGSIAIDALARLARCAEVIGALSHAALRGSPQAYDRRVHAAKNDPHAAGVADRMAALIGSPGPAARLQDPFGLRTIPQAHGAAEEAFAAAEAALAAEIDGAAENPLMVDAVALHHGQFLTQRLAGTLDAARAAALPVLTLSVARTSALLDPRLSGLPPFLAAESAASSGLLIVEYLTADLLARAGSLATVSSHRRAVVALGLEEHASHSTQSAWQTLELIEPARDLLACELVTTVRALRLAPTRLPAAGPARALYDAAAEVLPDIREDHVLGPELRAAAEVVGRCATYSPIGRSSSA
ncbi:aromatic amino acid ammonia-lyase [Millisia brevis]|uniref:aromatic amino acid ammonia-lyase n=1 Tax=Millisia brevis TaxID=264148 RepID=UPI0008302AEF|nr:aromatic amino acid ammonia-lyase [Millisia brevis]